MIRIFNRNMDYIGLLESFNSFSCSMKYADTGSFSIKTLLTDENKRLLQIGYFIQYEDFSGMIDTIQYQDDKKFQIIASGKDLNSLLDKRIILINNLFEGKSEEFLRKIVSENAITPTNPKRKLPFLKLGVLNGLPQLTTRNTKKETLLQMCKKVCNVANYGFTIDLNPKEKSMDFKVYQGADRTSGKPNQIILGEEYDNITNHDYIYSNQKEINNCIVWKDNIQVSVGEDLSGFDRCETAIETNTLQDTMSIEEYKKALASEGKDKLVGISECFDFDIIKENLNLGDKITVREIDWNVNYNSRITEKQIVIQNGNIIVTYLLGKDIENGG